MAKERIVFLFDVDNILLDNDRITADLMAHLEGEIGAERQGRYWEIFRQLRDELGYADYLGALQRYRIERPEEPHLIDVSLYLLNYPFSNRLFSQSLDVVERCQEWGQAVVLTEGDVVFQPHKLERSGLLDLFERQILIYIHKEQELDDVEHRYPADHYVVIDDNPGVLDRIKQSWGNRVTTVFTRQGRYAREQAAAARHPAADLTIARIGDFLEYSRDQVFSAGHSGHS